MECREGAGLNQVVFYPTENVTAEERMFRAGQLHYSGIPSDKIEVYKEAGDPSLRIQPYLGIYFYRLNVQQPHLRDKRVRRALGMTINRDQLVSQITKGDKSLPTQLLHPEPWVITLRVISHLILKQQKNF